MSESQSRYSIVERLTKQKLTLMEQKSSLSDDSKRKAQKVIQLEQDIESWKNHCEDEIKEVIADKKEEHSRWIRSQESGLARAKFDEQIAGENLEDKKKSYDERIAEIDKALTSILEISKSSVTP